MQKGNAQWFQQGLGARIDALVSALKSMLSSDEQDASLVKDLARSLCGPSSLYGFSRICLAARKVEQSSGDKLAEDVRALIDVLREEAAKTTQWVATILVVGGKPDFNERLAQAFGSPTREILWVDTAAEAISVMQKRDVVCVVLHLSLPDADGRRVLIQLREDPHTAAIPVLVIAAAITDEIREGTLVMDADTMLSNEADPTAIAKWVNARLRRARESAKSARREPVTGLLNRAAFKESFTRVMEEFRESPAPVAMALMSIDEARRVFEPQTDRSRDRILGRIGSVMSNCLRSTDIVARWGITEFVALFPGEDHFGGARAVEKILAAVRHEALGVDPPLTLSAGVTDIAMGASLDDALSDADRFLYQASSAGGNRVASSHSPVPKRAERVLLLMQDEMTSRVITHLFSKDGFDVTHLAEVRGPLAAEMGTHRYSLILIDEHIRDRDGFEILRELRADARYSRIPIAMLIGQQSAAQGVARALELGANDYMMRPFSPFTFIRRMRRMLKSGKIDTTRPSDICRILVVDNDRRALLMAASALHERGGFRPFLSLGMEDALGRFDEVGPDAILLDVDTDHDAFAKLTPDLIARAGAASTAVILTTSQEDPPRLSTPAHDVIRGSLRKPFNILTLAESVEETLRLAPCPRRPSDAAAHLSKELQRVSQREEAGS